MQIETFETEQDFIAASLKFFQKIAPTEVALSGGSTPKPFYQALTAANPDCNFSLVDERYVPLNHPDSNFKMIEDCGLSLTNHFDTSLPIPDSLAKYSAQIAPLTFDLAILGVGPDGHTASLFPHSPALSETAALTAHTQTSEFAIKDRLTLTFPKILASHHLLVLLKSKPEVLQELQHPTKSPQEFPAHTLTSHQSLTIHYLN